MAYTSDEIIEGVLKNYPQQDEVKLKNCTDENIGYNVATMHQYVIGLTRKDVHGNGIDQYEYRMRDKLNNIAPFKCLPWHFDDYELDELKAALNGVADYFQVKLDVDKIFVKENIRRGKGERLYLVVTVILYRILYAQ